MLEGGPAVLVRLKLAEIRIPATLAVTGMTPGAIGGESRSGGDTAAVGGCVAVADPANVPLAPLAGAVKVTVALLTGLPPVVTVACSAVVNALFMLALCGVPSLAMMLPVLLARAAAFSVTFPLPVAIAQVTFNV